VPTNPGGYGYYLPVYPNNRANASAACAWYQWLITITDNAVSAAAVHVGGTGGGSGYTVGDVLTVSGGTYVAQPCLLQVTSVGASNTVTGVMVLVPGDYTTSPGTSNVSVTGGTGTSAAFDLTITHPYTSITTHAAFADLRDLRLQDSDGVTLLNFWLKDNDSTNKIIRLTGTIPNVPAGVVDSPRYLWYGNAGASSVSSAANTYVSQNLPTVTDVFTQTDHAGYNSNPSATILQYQTGGNVARNGLIYAIFGGVGSNGNGTVGYIYKMECPQTSDPTNPSNWTGKASIGGRSVTVNSTGYLHDFCLLEMANGTLIRGYRYGTNANVAAAAIGTAYCSKSTDGGVTWNDASASSVSLGYTGFFLFTGKPIQQPNGDIWAPYYAQNSGDAAATWRAGIAICANGNDPSAGDSSWSKLVEVFFTVGVSFGEPALFKVSSTNYFMVCRNDTASTGGDLWISRSTDSGVTWSAPAALNLPGKGMTSTNAYYVSPHPLTTTLGNQLLFCGLRATSGHWGVGCLASSDGGATFGPVAPFGAGSTGVFTSYGYPAAVQRSDGKILVLQYRDDGLGDNLTNIAVSLTDEFYCFNPLGFYDGYESGLGNWSVTTGSTQDSGQKHSGTYSCKIDGNTAGAKITRAIAAAPQLYAKRLAVGFYLYSDTFTNIAGGPELILQDGNGSTNIEIAAVNASNTTSPYPYQGDSAGTFTDWTTHATLAATTWTEFIHYMDASSSSTPFILTKNHQNLGSNIRRAGTPVQWIKNLTISEGDPSAVNNVMHVDEATIGQYPPGGNVPTGTVGAEVVVAGHLLASLGCGA